MRMEQNPDGSIAAILHNTQCAVYYPDNTAKISCAGWYTNSTSAFIQSVTGVWITYRNNTAFASLRSPGEEFKWYAMPEGGLLFDSAGVPMNLAEVTERYLCHDTANTLRRKTNEFRKWMKNTLSLSPEIRSAPMTSGVDFTGLVLRIIEGDVTAYLPTAQHFNWDWHEFRANMYLTKGAIKTRVLPAGQLPKRDVY